jgi:uncharacterized protein YaaN involved in tellurite resistance
VDLAETKAERALPEPAVDDDLRNQAREYAARLIDQASPDQRDSSRAAVDLMGRDLQRRSAERSGMLQAPIKELSRGAEEGGPVAKSLVDLRVQVEALDPNRIDFSPGWLTRALGAIPGIGTPLKRYFMRYESTQTVIDSIINSLEKGRDQLSRDNITLTEDQRNMRDLTHELARMIALGQALDEMIVYKLEREIGADDERRKWIEEDLLFALRQRVIDLQQQLAVNQQGVLATELIVRNNRELIRGVDRAIDVTVSALQVAVTVALALAHQKIVLDKIEALNTTTSELIRGTAERLKTQGRQIQEQASTATLDMDALRSAFADITTAMDEISRFRREALPQMATTIVELDRLTEEGEEAVERMEATRRTDPLLELSVE